MKQAKSVDFMLAATEMNGEEVELYAEAENPTWNAEKGQFDDESATYGKLKAAILEQAAEHGIPVEKLKFWLDEA